MVEKLDKQTNLNRGNPNWKKGVSGNNAGRPKKEVCVTSWLKEYAGQQISKPIDASKLTYAQAAALSAWKAAAKGELDNYNFIIERIEGKITQKTDITTGGEKINGNRSIPTNVIDEAMEILYKAGCDTPPVGDSGTPQP